jgi:hypothetical protein
MRYPETCGERERAQVPSSNGGDLRDSQRELGYNATRFLQMLSEHGGLVTAKQLLWADKPSDGFTTLWDHGRLDLTVEAHVLLPEYEDLFSESDRQRARDRLEQYGWPQNR